MRASQRTGADMIVIFIGLLLVCTLIVAFLVYGQHWPRWWKARVPTTNMRDVERSVGRPLRISTNADGFINWDYTHWWSGSARVYFYTNGDFYRIFTEW